MAHDPFDTASDRFRGILKYWKAYVAVGAVLIMLVARGMIGSSGKDHLVSGEVIRIDQDGAASRALVRLGEAQQTVVTLSKSAHCHAGSKIRLVRSDNVTQHDYRPADRPCAS